MTKSQYETVEFQLKKKDIGNAFKHILKKKMPKKLIFGERDKNTRSVALTFISYEYKVPFEALKSTYYKILKNLPKNKIQPDLIKLLKANF